MTRALLAAKLGATPAGVALAEAVGFPLPLSECCGAAMRVGGEGRGEGATHWQECCACGKPTTPTAAASVKCEASGKSSGNGGGGVKANRRRVAASKRGAAARGFTLVELILAAVLTAVVAGAVVVTTRGAERSLQRATNELVVAQQAEQALTHFITHFRRHA